MDSSPKSDTELSVDETIVAMAAAVQAGDFSLAESLGLVAPIPLSIPKDSLQMGRIIYEGAQASVYEATWQGVPVAVKRARIREPDDLHRFRREVSILAALRNEPSIVKILGARLLPPDYAMVLRLEHTNAARALYPASHALTAGPSLANMRAWRPGWRESFKIGAQLASAVSRLHVMGVLHRDIKPANILLSEDHRTARLADLGIASRIEDARLHPDSRKVSSKPSGGFYKRDMVGTLEYMAPEVLLKGRHSTASDVFALAVTLNELAAGRVPYSDCTRDNPLAHTILEMGYGRQELASAVAVEGLRPTIAPGAPPALTKLLRACWDATPERRPTAEEIERSLSAWSSALDDPLDAAEEAYSGELKSNSIGMSHEALDRITMPTVIAGSLVGFELNAPPPWAVHLLETTGEESTIGEDQKGPSGVNLVLGSFATAGARGEDRMEDRCLVVRRLFGLANCTLAAVFDGHRGADAAEYLASNLERHLERLWAASESPAALLRDAVADADAAYRAAEQDAIRRGAEYDTKWPGSTATIAMVVGRHLTVANLGDSRAVLCRGGRPLLLTADQVASREDERARILSFSESVGLNPCIRQVDGQWRVGPGGLAVTRSVGDSDLKHLGVSAEAETSEVHLESGDEFLILGTDGIWDAMDAESAVALVHDTVKQAALSARRLVMEALARGSKDNVTAIVGFFSFGDAMVSTAERVFHAGQHKYSGRGGSKEKRLLTAQKPRRW